MKSSLSIWRYILSVKYTMKFSSIFVAFLENMTFTISGELPISIINEKRDKGSQNFLKLGMQKNW